MRLSDVATSGGGSLRAAIAVFIVILLLPAVAAGLGALLGRFVRRRRRRLASAAGQVTEVVPDGGVAGVAKSEPSGAISFAVGALLVGGLVGLLVLRRLAS